MSKHPVDATWRGVEKKSGKIGYIWLESRSGRRETWKWRKTSSDGTELRGWAGGDWGTSYKMCKDHMLIDCRMKRIK